MLENGFNRFPRASRSIRARGPIGKKCDNVPQNHSFEILASVAGKLLDKSEKCSDTDTSYFGRDQSCAFDGNARTKKVDDRDPLELRSCDCSLENAFRYNRSGTADSDGKHAFVDYRPCFSGLSERKLEEMNRDRRITDEIDILTVSSVDRKVSEDKPLESGCLFSCHTTNIQDVVHGYGDKTLLSTGDKRESNGKLALGVKDESYYTTDAKIEEVHDDKRTCHANEKSQKIFPFKKRKFFNHDPLSLADQGFHRKEAFNSPENRINGKFCGAGQDLSPNSEECNVKLSIKSFKVPELFIDISTNATVGSLKRSVMKAVTSILGEGLHVGILVQGKKVRDDNKTLIQTGISQDDKSHNLGFVLEPKHSRTTMPTSFKNEPLLSRTQSHELTMHLASQRRTSKDSLHPQFKKNLDGCVGTELGAVKTLADTSTTKMNPDSKSLVPVPKISMKALAVVPLHQKPGHHEYGQRRIRRPFSVSEVEALVRAVEKLGTGRWRDVKFHAFDNAKHRTYVDLKDKWKTLVHTARISPQQRRGEPVPQELLDRVLAAQAFWSHRQAKQHPMIAI